MFQSRYRRFPEPASIKLAADGIVELAATSGAASVRITEADLALARLFDGTRDAAAVRLAARDQLGREIDPDRLEGLVAELAISGLIQAGSHEPVPVPVQSDEEAQLLGWIGPGKTLPQIPADAALPPSTVLGSRYGPGLLGGLMGLVGGQRGQANRIGVHLPSAPFLVIGRLLIWPLRSRASLLLFMVLFIAALWAVGAHRLEWVRQGAALVQGNWLPPLLIAALLTNLASAAARAATIAGYTPENPAVGLLFSGPLRLPRLFVDTSGAAERARSADRLRVVGSGLIGIAALVVLSVLGVFLYGQTLPALGQQAVATAAVGVILLVLRLNPLALYEGHYLLAHWLGHPDLRTQAWSALLKFERPWPVATRKMSRRTLVLYAVLVILFLILTLLLMFLFLGDWLMQRFGGVGFLIFAGFLTIAFRTQYLRSGAVKDPLGRPKPPPWRPTRRTWTTAGVALLVALIPYHYEPGGTFVVLPGERAEVLALVDGDVREVRAREGDTVSAGQVLVQLGDARPRAELAAAEALLARLEADLALLKKGLRIEAVELARERWMTAERKARLAEAEARRAGTAFRGGDLNAHVQELAQGAADVAREHAVEARHALELASSPAQEEKIAAAEAAIAQAKADRELRAQQLEYTQIRAPIAGRVLAPRLHYARGDVLDRGESLARIENPARVLAEVSVAEADVPRLHLDGEGSVKPWAFAGRSFDARVHSIAPAAETGESGRFVRVQLAVEDPEARLLSGMTGQAKIDGGWQPAALVFTRALLRFLFVRAWSWIP